MPTRRFPKSVVTAAALLACLAVIGAIGEPCGASELSDAVAKVRRLAAAEKYEEAVGLLEGVLGSVIGDPDSATAQQTLVDCYLKWLEQATKRKSPSEQARVLARVSLKQPAVAKDIDAKPKFLAAMKDWETEAARKKDLTEPLRQAALLRTMPDKDLADLHKGLLAEQVALLSQGPGGEGFLAALLDYQVKCKYPQEEIAAEVRKKAAEALVKQARVFCAPSAPQPERGWQLCCLARKWGGAEGPKDLGAVQDKLTLQMGSWYLNLHDPNRAGDWFQKALESNDPKTVEEARKSLKQIDAQAEEYAKTAIFPATIDKDARVKALPVPYVIQGTTTIAAGVQLTLEPGVHLQGGTLDFKNARLVAKGTADNPIILQDIVFHNQDPMSLSVTGDHCVMVRCKHTHNGVKWAHAQRKTLVDSYVLHVPNQHMDIWEEFFLTNCTLRYGRYHVADCSYKKLENLTLEHCQVNGLFLFAVQKGNLFDCSYFDDDGGLNFEINLPRNLTQEWLWLDAASGPILDKWPRVAKYSKDTKGTLLFSAAGAPIPRCGASWPCPTFKTCEELAGSFD